jgi:hypothetical protein
MVCTNVWNPETGILVFPILAELLLLFILPGFRALYFVDVLQLAALNDQADLAVLTERGKQLIDLLHVLHS